MTEDVAAGSDLPTVASRLHRAGVHRIGVLTWRDLDDPGSGGSEIHINRLASLWADADLDVTVHTGAVPGLPPVTQRNGAIVRRAGGRMGSVLRGPVGVRRGRYDAIVEAWHGFNFAAPLWAGPTPRMGIAHHVHQEQFRHLLPGPMARAAALVERRVYPWLYRNTPLVTLSSSTRDQMIGLGYDPHLVTVAPPGVDPSFVPGVRSTTPTVVAVGRLMPQKRMDEVVRVLADVRGRVPDLQAEIIGAGPGLATLQNQVRAAGATSWLRLRGRVSHQELVSAYQRAWAVVSASVSEGWGMSLSEAAACATPGVATDIPGHRDVISSGRSGWLASSGEEMVARLHGLVSSRDQVERMGAVARATVAGLTWERCAASTLAPLAEPSPVP